MEQTIGRRIAENRKRLGMTQDQLAEKLGVTAQAVSKWENDQSCPDITMLPRLAEIFGISTDALLGRDTAQPVHTAEVIDEEENEPEGLHIDNGNWEFHWGGGKTSRGQPVARPAEQQRVGQGAPLRGLRDPASRIVRFRQSKPVHSTPPLKLRFSDDFILS